jgi:hypothetical protein
LASTHETGIPKPIWATGLVTAAAARINNPPPRGEMALLIREAFFAWHFDVKKGATMPRSAQL